MRADLLMTGFLTLTIFVWLIYSRVRNVGHFRRLFVAAMLTFTGIMVIQYNFPTSKPPEALKPQVQASAPLGSGAIPVQPAAK